jgi:hypothetical protein
MIIELKVVIPANSKALIVLPNKEIEVAGGIHNFEINQ